MSFFAHATAARRYADARPFFHPLVIDRIGALAHVTTPFERALDVACGTGQSTLPLRKIARQVIGTDRSPAMLGTAQREANIHYAVAAAEQQPFAANSFDLITVALAFHWFERQAFLVEAKRVLKSDGWLAIYNNSVFGRMHGKPAFKRWFRDVYIARYPSPPRDQQPFTDAYAAAAGFQFVRREHYTNDVRFALESFVSYLLTQTNVIAAVEEGNESLAAVEQWLHDELRPWFTHPVETFEFGGPLWLLRSTA